MKWPWVLRSRLELAHKCQEDQRTIIEEQRQRLVDVAAAQVFILLAKGQVENLELELKSERNERRRLAGELLAVVDYATAAERVVTDSTAIIESLRGTIDAICKRRGVSP